MNIETTDPNKARAYQLLLLLLEERTDEADLYDSLLDEIESRELSRLALSLAAAVMQQAWGDRAIDRVRLLIEIEEGNHA
jgi:hypothetical protein